MVFVRDDAEHRGATGKSSPYMVSGGADARDNYQFVPETSRRARGFTVVMLRFVDPAGQDDEASTQAVIVRIHQDGTTWGGTTAWRGVTALRISVSGWKTTDEDVDRSIDAISQLAAP
jgi:hypothetical protein